MRGRGVQYHNKLKATKGFCEDALRLSHSLVSIKGTTLSEVTC